MQGAGAHDYRISERIERLPMSIWQVKRASSLALRLSLMLSIHLQSHRFHRRSFRCGKLRRRKSVC